MRGVCLQRAVRVPLFLLVLVSASTIPAPASAEPVWLLLPAALRDAPDPSEAWVRELGRMLRAQGIYPLALDEAASLFEARHSSAPEAARASDLDVVAREAQKALLHVATGHNADARKSVEQVLSRAERALESLNRQTDAARHVLNACLYLVRAMLESGHRDAARGRALECRRLVPDIEPDPQDHPPAVMALLERVGIQLATAHTGSLRVESAPPGCDVYLNGRRVGTSPYEIRQLPPGGYRVQAECSDRVGRVHRIVLAAEPTLVRIDHRFDAVVRSAHTLALQYPDRHAARKYRLGDARRIGRVVDAEQVVLLTPERPRGTLRLDRVDVDTERVMASVRLPARPTGRVLAGKTTAAVTALRRARIIDLSGNAPRPMDTRVAPEVSSLSRASFEPRPTAHASSSKTIGTEAQATATKGPGDPIAREVGQLPPRVTGWALGTAGVATAVAGWGMWAKLKRRNEELSAALPMDPDYLARQRRVDRTALATGLLGASGGAVITTSLPWLLPPRQVTPWWAWTSGGVGLALAAWSIVPFVAGDLPPALDHDCIDQACTRHQQTKLLGSVLLAHAVPLIAIPLTYVVRGASASHAETPVAVGARLGGHGAELFLGGRL